MIATQIPVKKFLNYSKIRGVSGGERRCGGNVNDAESRGAQEAWARGWGRMGARSGACVQSKPPAPPLFLLPTDKLLNEGDGAFPPCDQQTAFQGNAAC